MKPHGAACHLDILFDDVFAVPRGIDDVNATVTVRDRQMSVNGSLIMMTSPLHEPLVQAMSGARFAGIVSAWSEGL